MRKLTDNELYLASAGSFFRDLFKNVDSIEAKPSTWYVPSLACGLSLVTILLSAIATATVKPKAPLSGLPVSISLGMGIFATTYIIGEALEWAYPSTTTYVINHKQ